MTAMPRLPALRSFPKTVDAQCYNRVRLALRRLGCPLRVSLPQLRGLDAILEDRRWLCVDRRRDDLPLLAWLDFGVAGRDAVLEPIACRIELYTWQSGLIMGPALEALDQAMQEALTHSPLRPPGSLRIVDLKERRRESAERGTRL